MSKRSADGGNDEPTHPEIETTGEEYPAPPTDDDVNQETIFLAQLLEIFKRAIKIDHDDWEPEYDLVVVANIARSYLDDVWRYEVYHMGTNRETRANSVKRAAYLTKWICRFRPMYMKRQMSSTEDFLDSYKRASDDSLIINEAFAIHLALQAIAEESQVDDIELTPKFYDRLIYNLHFRHLHEDSMLEIYDIVTDCITEDPPVVVR